MGRVLYPEWSKLEGEDVWSLDKHHIADTWFVCINMDSGCHRVHWYEFLVRWIIPGIYGTGTKIYPGDTADTNIDFLYKDFRIRHPEDNLVVS